MERRRIDVRVAAKPISATNSIGRKSSGFPSLQPSEMPSAACRFAINVAVSAGLT
jgi:hypothetical protein